MSQRGPFQIQTLSQLQSQLQHQPLFQLQQLQPQIQLQPQFQPQAQVQTQPQAQQYAFDYLANATPDIMKAFYDYFNLKGDNRNITNLVTLLQRDNLLNKADNQMFTAIAADTSSQAMAKLWDFPMDKLELLFKILQSTPPINKTKSEYFRRIVGTFQVGSPDFMKNLRKADVEYYELMLKKFSQIRNQVQHDDKTSAILDLSNLQLSLVNTNVGAQNLSDYIEDSSKIRPRDLSITLNDFIKVIDDQNFIDKYKQSLTFLYVEKLEFYLDRYNELQSELNRMEREFIPLKTLDPDVNINTVYPMYRPISDVRNQMASIMDIITYYLGNGFNDNELREGFKSAIYDPINGLNSLTGRMHIKNTIARIIYSFYNDYHVFTKLFNNFAIYGPAGVGKTKIGTIIGFVFNKIKLLVKGTFKVATRAELVAQHIGGTAPQTRLVLLKSLEGVLLIDEAYQIPGGVAGSEGSRDFGFEAITELVNFLDKFVGKNIVIVAGYRKQMEEIFMKSNEGLPRRFPYVLILEPYSNEELTTILLRFVIENTYGITIDNPTASYIYSLIMRISAQNPKAFENQAGDMLNLSGFLVRAIQSSFSIPWKNGNIENNKPIILNGFNDFLMPKQIQLYLNAQ